MPSIPMAKSSKPSQLKSPDVKEEPKPDPLMPNVEALMLCFAEERGEPLPPPVIT